MKKVGSKRFQKSFEQKDKGGVKRKSAIDWDKLAGEDKQIEFFKPIVGTNRFNIIPYVVRSSRHPLIQQGELEKGSLDYILDIWVHTYIGPEQADITCPKKNYGKPCPICEEVSRLYDQQESDEAKKLQASRRGLYNVIPMLGEDSGKLMVFNSSHFKFEKEMIEEANACKEGEGIIPFSELGKEGRIVQYRVATEKFGKNDVNNYKNFQFLERDEAIGEEILDQVIPLDQGIILLTYDEIHKLFFEGGEAGEDKPKRESKKEESKKDSDTVSEDPPTPDKPKEEKKEVPKDEDKCTHGHTFGKDGDKKPECEGCKPVKHWERCVKLSEGG